MCRRPLLFITVLVLVGIVHATDGRAVEPNQKDIFGKHTWQEVSDLRDHLVRELQELKKNEDHDAVFERYKELAELNQHVFTFKTSEIKNTPWGDSYLTIPEFDTVVDLDRLIDDASKYADSIDRPLEAISWLEKQSSIRLLDTGRLGLRHKKIAAFAKQAEREGRTETGRIYRRRLAQRDGRDFQRTVDSHRSRRRSRKKLLKQLFLLPTTLMLLTLGSKRVRFPTPHRPTKIHPGTQFRAVIKPVERHRNDRIIGLTSLIFGILTLIGATIFAVKGIDLSGRQMFIAFAIAGCVISYALIAFAIAIWRNRFIPTTTIFRKTIDNPQQQIWEVLETANQRPDLVSQFEAQADDPLVIATIREWQSRTSWRPNTSTTKLWLEAAKHYPTLSVADLLTWGLQHAADDEVGRIEFAPLLLRRPTLLTTETISKISIAETARLEYAMINGFRWTEWPQDWFCHPEVLPTSSTILWGVFNASDEIRSTFRIDADGTFVDADFEEVFHSSDARIGVPHLYELRDDEIRRWEHHFAEANIVSVIRQFEPIRSSRHVGLVPQNQWSDDEFVFPEFGWMVTERERIRPIPSIHGERAPRTSVGIDILRAEVELHEQNPEEPTLLFEPEKFAELLRG